MALKSFLSGFLSQLKNQQRTLNIILLFRWCYKNTIFSPQASMSNMQISARRFFSFRLAILSIFWFCFQVSGNRRSGTASCFFFKTSTCTLYDFLYGKLRKNGFLLTRLFARVSLVSGEKNHRKERENLKLFNSTNAFLMIMIQFDSRKCVIDFFHVLSSSNTQIAKFNLRECWTS